MAQEDFVPGRPWRQYRHSHQRQRCSEWNYLLAVAPEGCGEPSHTNRKQSGAEQQRCSPSQAMEDTVLQPKFFLTPKLRRSKKQDYQSQCARTVFSSAKLDQK